MAQSGINPGTLKWAAISGATFIISFILISCVLPRMFSSVDWTLKLRLKTAERINSSIHSTCATIVSGHFLYQQLFNIGHMQYDAVNPQSMEYALAMSMGYFLADTFVMWFQYTRQFEDAPVTFTAHHGVCISYILGVLHLGVGFQTAVVAWFCGEMTNPVQNAWFITKDTCGPESDFYAELSKWFTYYFVSVRCVLTPAWSTHVVWFCFSYDTKFGRFGPVFGLLCIFINIGGVWWARGLWKGYQRFTERKSKAV